MTYSYPCVEITIKLRGEVDTCVLDGCEYEFGEAKEVWTLTTQTIGVYSTEILTMQPPPDVLL